MGRLSRILQRFAAGAGFALVLAACASFTFPKHYGLDVDGVPAEVLEQKRLLGPAEDGSQHLPLSVCNSTAEDRTPCSVIRTNEVYRLRTRVRELEARLKACEEGHR